MDIKVKLLSNVKMSVLEQEINNFLESAHGVLVDIKYSNTMVSEFITEYSAMIIYMICEQPVVTTLDKIIEQHQNK